MFSTVLGLFSQDLAVDLGSSRTRIHMRGSGSLCDEPTVVAVQVHRDGRRRVLAIGNEALPMLGRTPDDILAIQPVRNGHVEDFEVAEALLLQLVRRTQGRTGLLRPRMAVALPSGLDDLQTRALRDACEAAGARETHLVPRPLAAALGAGLPVDEPNGHLVVDVGGGHTEIAVLSLSSVVHSARAAGGGDLDRAIVDYVKRHHATEIGLPTAEYLKCTLGSALPGSLTGSHVVKGRCLRLGIPRAITLEAQEVHAAIAPSIRELAQAIVVAMEASPPQIASDIVENGVILVGGGADLDGLDEALRQLTGVAVVIAEEPAHAVARGTSSVLEHHEMTRTVTF